MDINQKILLKLQRNLASKGIYEDFYKSHQKGQSFYLRPLIDYAVNKIKVLNNSESDSSFDEHEDVIVPSPRGHGNPTKDSTMTDEMNTGAQYSDRNNYQGGQNNEQIS